MTYPLKTAAQNYQALKAALLAVMPDLADDPECLLDTIDGETDICEQLAKVLRSAKLEEAFAEGLMLLIKDHEDRLADLRNRAEKKRRIVLHFMADLDIKALNMPDMTVTRRIVPPSVVIVREDLIPKEYMRVTYTPNKTMIKHALTDGKSIDGCMLSNTRETISIKI